MEQVVQDFIDSLNSRIDLLNSMEVKLDSSKVDQVESIIDKYQVLDSSRFNKEDLEYVLYLADIPESDNYKEIDKEIQDFIDRFNNARNTHLNESESSTNKYNKYIDLLTSDKEGFLFIDYDDLDEVMSEVGLAIPDKWKIISYINNKNINNNKNKINILNLNSKELTFNKLYLDNQDLNTYINDNIKDINIDIDMIPSLSKKLVNNSYDEVTIKNAMGTIILNELYKELNEIEDEEQIDNLNEMVKDTLNYIDNYEDKIVNPLKDIVVEYEDLLNEEINKGNDINTYVDISVDDLEKLVGDHDKALALKKLPIIKSIKDTINNIDECDKSSDDFIKYLNLLKDLNKVLQENN